MSIFSSNAVFVIVGNFCSLRFSFSFFIFMSPVLSIEFMPLLDT